jgi:hypothetical protein
MCHPALRPQHAAPRDEALDLHAATLGLDVGAQLEVLLWLATLASDDRRHRASEPAPVPTLAW